MFDTLPETTLMVVGPLVVIVTTCLVCLGLLFVDRTRLRRAAYTQWESYLECIRSSLRHLRQLENSLGEARKECAGKEPPPQHRRLEKVIRTEIAALDAQLTTLIDAPNSFYYRGLVEWRPFPSLGEGMLEFVETAKTGEAADETGSQVCPSEVESDLRANVDSLKNRNLAVSDMIEEMKREYDGLQARREGTPTSEYPIRQDEFSEEAVAAKLMRDLPSGGPLDALETELEEARSEIKAIEEKLRGATFSAAHKAKLSGKLEWLLQTKRWLAVQRKIRHQEMLLKQVNGRIAKSEESEYKQRLEKWLDYHTLEDRNEDLEEKVAKLHVENRMLQRHLSAMDSEQSTLELMQGNLVRATGLQGASQGALRRLENLADRLGERFANRRFHEKQIANLEKKLLATKETKKEYEKAIRSLHRQRQGLQAHFDTERDMFKATVGLLEEALETTAQDKEHLATEVAELRGKGAKPAESVGGNGKTLDTSELVSA